MPSYDTVDYIITGLSAKGSVRLPVIQDWTQVAWYLSSRCPPAVRSPWTVAPKAQYFLCSTQRLCLRKWEFSHVSHLQWMSDGDYWMWQWCVEPVLLCVWVKLGMWHGTVLLSKWSLECDKGLVLLCLSKAWNVTWNLISIRWQVSSPVTILAKKFSSYVLKRRNNSEEIVVLCNRLSSVLSCAILKKSESFYTFICTTIAKWQL